MSEKLKHGTTEYWMDWYWNRGGREKVQQKRKLREYLNAIKKESSQQVKAVSSHNQ